MDASDGWLLLKTAKNIGDKTLYDLYRAFGSYENVEKASKEDLKAIIGSKTAYLENLNEEVFKSNQKLLKSNGVKYVSFEDKLYPKALFDLRVPPAVIFYKGELKSSDKSISLIGTRRPSLESSLIAKAISKALAQNEFYGISGAASGIDSILHRAFNEEKKPNMAVLGFGHCFAKGSLFKDILENGGSLVSEFFPMEKPTKYGFAKRNRLIAALGQKMVLIEASLESGSMISASWAASLKRPIYAYIGKATESFLGSSKLIREQKAKLFISKEELFEDLNINFQTKKEENKNPILELLKEPMSFDDILSFLDIKEKDLLRELSILEIKGLIKRKGNYFIKNE